MPANQGGMVVVIEDDDSMREAIERLLMVGGFGCIAYASGKPLLAQKSHEQAKCIISDLRLPDMSGLDLLVTLRNQCRSIPFILITAHDTPELRQEALKLGATAYLAKPFRGTALLEAVQASFEQAGGTLAH